MAKTGALKTAARHRSPLLRSIHLAANDLQKAGLIDKVTMRQFDVDCMTHVKPLAPDEIRHIREEAHMSQATFALVLNVNRYLVSKWERGESKPTGATLKLLALADKKGIDAIL